MKYTKAFKIEDTELTDDSACLKCGKKELPHTGDSEINIFGYCLCNVK